MDDFTKFVWLIPLKQKSDFFDHFILFEIFVKRQFNGVIKKLQTNGVGEFENQHFKNHLLNSRIVHQLSCPYTPEQNGMVEMRHRVIRELGITMLIHANVPKLFWVEAFTISVFLLNRTPTTTLQ